MLKNASSNMQFKGKMVFFITGNFHKFNEVRSILGPMGIAVGMLRMKGNEIQADTTSEIAINSATEAFSRCRLPLIVEDAGLFIDALDGFPGPYAAYAFKSIHNSGILKLMENVQNRKATFHSSIVYCDQETRPMLFEGDTKGEITLTERWGDGKAGFGFDPIFDPKGCNKTFAEMSLEEKNKVSHRSKAVKQFAEWYKQA